MSARRRLLGWLALAGAHASAAALLSGCAPEEADTIVKGGEAGAAADAPAAADGVADGLAAGDGGAGTLEATLELPTPGSPVGTPLEIRISARNDTAAPVELLTWNTPFESVLSADVFDIVREADGVHVAYRGRVLKRSLPPPADALVTLAPGELVEATIDLARHYALERPGTYTVRFDPLEVPVRVEGRVLAKLIAGDSEALAFERF